MSHSICTSQAGETLAYFRRLWQTLLAPDVDPSVRLEQLFEREAAEFDFEYAFLSHIDPEAGTERFEVVHGSHEALKPDATVPLSKTYCRKTIADPEGTMAVDDAVAEGWEGDPAYEAFGMGSYVGTTVSVGDELYGTLCFADTAARDDPIVDGEKALLEMYAQWVAHTLSRGDGPPIRGSYVDTIDGHAVSPAAIDSMMDALGNRTRRTVLAALLEDDAETSVTALERRLSHENAGIRLYHRDLPELADAGYVDWERGTGTVGRGPNFAEVEPLVHLLNEYGAPSPE